MYHAFQAALTLNSLCDEGDVPKLRGSPSSALFVFEIPARISYRAACASPTCTDFDPSLRTTITFSSCFRFCEQHIAIALSETHLRFGSPPAMARVHCSHVVTLHFLPVTFSVEILLRVANSGVALRPRLRLHRRRPANPAVCSAPPVGRLHLPPSFPRSWIPPTEYLYRINSEKKTVSAQAN